MRYHVTHQTRFDVQERVSIGMNQVYLTPRTMAGQICENFRLLTRPATSSMERWIDYYGNVSHYLSFERGYDHLEISGMSKVEVQPRWIPPHEQSPLVRTILEQLILNHTETGLHPLEMREASPRIDHEHEAVIQYANEIFHEERPILVCLRDLLARFAEEFKFDSTATTVNSTVEEVLVNRRGVCQDFTHLAIALCRAKRIPARYVSGYLRTHPPAGKPRRRGADASHAWVSVYCGTLGWVDLDPTNNIFVSDEHITVAWGRDYGDIAPVKGVVIGAGAHTLSVSVDVEPVDYDVADDD